MIFYGVLELSKTGYRANMGLAGKHRDRILWNPGMYSAEGTWLQLMCCTLSDCIKVSPNLQRGTELVGVQDTEGGQGFWVRFRVQDTGKGWSLGYREDQSPGYNKGLESSRSSQGTGDG